MAIDRRKKNFNWFVSDNQGNTHHPSVGRDGAVLATLMDIRDELRDLNRLLGCRNFTGIPTTLRAIQRNTKKEPK